MPPAPGFFFSVWSTGLIILIGTSYMRWTMTTGSPVKEKKKSITKLNCELHLFINTFIFMKKVNLNHKEFWVSLIFLRSLLPVIAAEIFSLSSAGGPSKKKL